jgi:hypothetical protein
MNSATRRVRGTAFDQDHFDGWSPCQVNDSLQYTFPYCRTSTLVVLVFVFRVTSTVHKTYGTCTGTTTPGTVQYLVLFFDVRPKGKSHAHDSRTVDWEYGTRYKYSLLLGCRPSSFVVFPVQSYHIKMALNRSILKRCTTPYVLKTGLH